MRRRPANRARPSRTRLGTGRFSCPTVGVAQLVELLVVVQAVVGSSPIAHLSKSLVIADYQSGGALGPPKVSINCPSICWRTYGIWGLGAGLLAELVTISTHLSVILFAEENERDEAMDAFVADLTNIASWLSER